MDVNIKWEPSGKSGAVARDCRLLGAASSLGVEIHYKRDCPQNGECGLCQVMVLEGGDGLSPITESERQHLGEAQLAAGMRLACQARLQGAEVTVRVPVLQEAEQQARKEAEATEEQRSEARRIAEEFDKLPLDQKLAALAEMGINVAGDLIGALIAVPLKVAEEILSSVSSAQKSAGQERSSGPAAKEHSKQKAEPSQQSESKPEGPTQS